MPKGKPETTCGDHGGHRQDGRECGRPEGWGTDFDTGKCRDCRGTSPDGESHKNNNNAQSHGLHTSAETFFANAEQHHLDTYYALHESLCSRYEVLHGVLPHHIKKDLAEIAFEMTKLDMAKEYQAENAVDDSKPLTEKEPELTEQGVWEKEVVSKVETLKTNIRRENRLALKDMGIYNSPEQAQAEATSELGEIVAEALEPQD